MPAWKRECLVQTSKHCFWEGQFLYCCWQGWTLIQRPYKGLAYSVLGWSWLGLWPLSPSKPLNWHDASLSPILDWWLGVVAFRPLSQEQTAVVLYVMEQGSNPQLKHNGDWDREAAFSWKVPRALNSYVQWSFEWGTCTPGVKVIH